MKINVCLGKSMEESFEREREREESFERMAGNVKKGESDIDLGESLIMMKREREEHGDHQS